MYFVCIKSHFEEMTHNEFELFEDAVCFAIERDGLLRFSNPNTKFTVSIYSGTTDSIREIVSFRTIQ